MNDSEFMLSLLRRLKVEMNGAVSASMTERGVAYGLNYGVSIPTIKDITKPYFPNHSLASLLYKQDVRELKLAALFIDDPSEVSRDQMLQWGQSIVNSEIAEQAVSQLFSKTTAAPEVAILWIESSDPLLCYAGLLMAARVITPHKCDSLNSVYFLNSENSIEMLNKILDSSVTSLYTWLGNTQFKLVSRAVTQLLCKAALLSEVQEKVKTIIATLATSQELPFRHVGDEVQALLNISVE